MAPKVMIVEDDAAIRNLYGYLLRSAGYEVVEAFDGQDALEKYIEQPCNMVITDMNMPRMNGMQLVEELRRRSPDVHIIMITAYGTTDTPREAFSRGTNDYMAKPFEVEELRDRVKGYFESQPQIDDSSEAQT